MVGLYSNSTGGVIGSQLPTRSPQMNRAPEVLALRGAQKPMLFSSAHLLPKAPIPLVLTQSRHPVIHVIGDR